jgi:hypothetical protein
MENWKKIKGFENYEISDYGNIKSFCLKKERILKHKVDKDGYLGIGLFLDKKIYYKKIHRLVMYHFSNEIEKETVNHIDGNKKNNYISNLEWNTRSENNKHAYLIGLKVQKAEHLKKRIKVTKLGFEKEYNSIKEAAIELNLDANCLSKVCRGKHKTHNQYKAVYI